MISQHERRKRRVEIAVHPEMQNVVALRITNKFLIIQLPHALDTLESCAQGQPIQSLYMTVENGRRNEYEPLHLVKNVQRQNSHRFPLESILVGPIYVAPLGNRWRKDLPTHLAG